MPCDWLQKDGVTIHLNVARGRQKTCKFCRGKYRDGKLCDFPVGNGRTCDAEMCSGCAKTIGRQDTDLGHGITRPNDFYDVCPIHQQVLTKGATP